MVSSPSGKFPEVILGGNFTRVPTTRLACSPAAHASQSIHWYSVGSDIEVCWGLSSILSLAQGAPPPNRNFWTRGSREGGHLRSSYSGLASGLDQSEGSPVPSLSFQISGWGSPALVCSPGSTSKVTCCLSYTGLGDLACLLVDFPWHDATRGLCSDDSQSLICVDGCLSTCCSPTASDHG